MEGEGGGGSRGGGGTDKRPDFSPAPATTNTRQIVGIGAERACVRRQAGMVFWGGATKQTRETLACTNTLRRALVSYNKHGTGRSGQGTHIWNIPSAASAERVPAGSAAAPCWGAALRQAPGAAAAVCRAAVAAPRESGGAIPSRATRRTTTRSRPSDRVPHGACFVVTTKFFGELSWWLLLLLTAKICGDRTRSCTRSSWW